MEVLLHLWKHQARSNEISLISRAESVYLWNWRMESLKLENGKKLCFNRKLCTVHSSRYSDSSPVPCLWATLHLLCKLQVTDGGANLVSPGGHLIDLLNTVEESVLTPTCTLNWIRLPFPNCQTLLYFWCSQFAWISGHNLPNECFQFSSFLPDLTSPRLKPEQPDLYWISGSPDHLPRFWRDPMHWSLMTCYKSGRTHHCRRPFMNWISQDRWAKACVTHVQHGGNQDCQHHHQEHWHLVRGR